MESWRFLTDLGVLKGIDNSQTTFYIVGVPAPNGAIMLDLLGLKGHKDPVDQYLSEIHSGMDYFAAWVPFRPLNIGDIGNVKNNRFDQRSNLKSKGIDFEILKSHTQLEMHYYSKNAVDIHAKIAGGIDTIKRLLGGIEADFVIHFTRENAICLVLGNCQTYVIKDLDDIAKEINDRFIGWKWDRDWAIITELVTAKNALVVLSGDKEAWAGFNLAGNATMPYTDIFGANANVGLQMASEHELNFQSVTREEITPLFRLCSLRQDKTRQGKTKLSIERSQKLFHKSLKPPAYSDDAQEIFKRQLVFTPVMFDPQQLGECKELQWF